MAKAKSAKAAPKRGQAKGPRGQANKVMASQKRQVEDDADSTSSNDSQQRQSRKRQKKKSKQAAPVESVDDSSSDSPEPEVVETLDDSRTEGTGQSVEVCIIMLQTTHTS
jgi:hypothetical protein